MVTSQQPYWSAQVGHCLVGKPLCPTHWGTTAATSIQGWHLARCASRCIHCLAQELGCSTQQEARGCWKLWTVVWKQRGKDSLRCLVCLEWYVFSDLPMT